MNQICFKGLATQELCTATSLLSTGPGICSTAGMIYQQRSTMPSILFSRHSLSNFDVLLIYIFFWLPAFPSSPISPFKPFSMIAPLAFVVELSMIKEALEDWKRFLQDVKVNRRKVDVHKGNGAFGRKPWEEIEVGDVVKVEKDQFFPADMLLLSSSYEDGICYVETMNLDGETNLKPKRCLEVTLPLDSDEIFNDFTGTIRCGEP